MWDHSIKWNIAQLNVTRFNTMWNHSTKCEIIQQGVEWFNKMWNNSTKRGMICVHVNWHDIFWNDVICADLARLVLMWFIKLWSESTRCFRLIDWTSFEENHIEITRKSKEITMKFVGIKFTYGNFPPEMEINYRSSQSQVHFSTRNSDVRT